MQYVPASAMDRKTELESRLAKIREAVPQGTMYTQLRPGKRDYTLWVKVNKPKGNGKYERRALEEIDPDSSAPDFDVRFPKPTKALETLTSTAARVMAMKTPSTPELEGEVDTTITNAQ